MATRTARRYGTREGRGECPTCGRTRVLYRPAGSLADRLAETGSDGPYCAECFASHIRYDGEES